MPDAITPPVITPPAPTTVLAPPSPAAAPVVPAPDPYAAELADLRKFKADQIAATTAADMAKKIAEGKQQEVIDAQAKKIAELEPRAASLAAIETAESARISEAMKALPADKQALINAQPSITLKAQLLAAFGGATTAAPPLPPPPGGGPPPPAGDRVSGNDVAALVAKNVHPAVIRQAHPQAWAEYLAANGIAADGAPTPSPSTGPSSRHLFAVKKTA